METGYAPRCECGLVGHAVCSCYMYRPVAPIVLSRNRGDRRPVGAPAMISARCHGVRVHCGEPFLRRVRGGHVILYP